MPVKVVFLHGREGTPEGDKVRALRNMGYEVMAPSLDKNDWAVSVNQACDAIESFLPDVVVGSSRGGAVAMATNTRRPMVLICPAWQKNNPWSTCRADSVILHARSDAVVPYADSARLAHATGAALVVCGSDHRMNTPEAFAALHAAVERVRSDPMGDRV